MSFSSGPLTRTAKPFAASSSALSSSHQHGAGAGQSSEHSIKNFLRKVVNKIDDVAHQTILTHDNDGTHHDTNANKVKARQSSNSYSSGTSRGNNSNSVARNASRRQESNSSSISQTALDDELQVGTQSVNR